MIFRLHERTKSRPLRRLFLILERSFVACKDGSVVPSMLSHLVRLVLDPVACHHPFIEIPIGLVHFDPANVLLCEVEENKYVDKTNIEFDQPQHRRQPWVTKTRPMSASIISRIELVRHFQSLWDPSSIKQFKKKQ
jgi:hypothetical protein